MPVRVNVGDDVITAYISGEIDHHNARRIRDEIDRAIERAMPDTLIMDFRDVSFMDSSGIGLVMGRYKQMQMTGGEVHLANISESMRKVMRLAGLSKLVGLNEGGIRSHDEGN